MTQTREDPTFPKLIMLFGPPAVGKLSVGQELSKLCGHKLFYNHQTIDLLLNFFPYGSPAFMRLNDLFRKEIFQELGQQPEGGMIFTYVWDLGDVEDKKALDTLVHAFGLKDNDPVYIELYAPQAIRLERNKTENRLQHKPSKRDIERSEQNLLFMDAAHILNTTEDHPFYYPDRHIRIDNSQLSPAEAAKTILDEISKLLKK